MKFVVVGTGGVGGYFGGLLASAGVETWFLARGAHLAAMRASGLRIHAADRELTIPPGRMTDDPRDAGHADVVLFCVKGYDTEAAAATTTPLLTGDTVVINLQNGVEKEERLARLLPCGTVYGGVAFIYATVTAPGVITASPGVRRLIFGPLESNATESSRAAAVLNTMTAAGVPAVLSPEIRVEIWKKFVFISAVGGLTALTRLTIGELLAASETRALLEDAMRETAAVARSRGIRLPADTVDGFLSRLSSMTQSTRSSLHYDLVHNKPLEIEELSGTVVRLGLAAGIPTPVHRFIHAALLPHHRSAIRMLGSAPTQE
jgi:2-dehydropantoate 2-reductase